MAEVLLFHHALGQTEGFKAFADELRRAGHPVHTPDLYDGRTFVTLDEGVAHAEEIGFPEIIERGERAADALTDELVYAGFSLGVLPAQKLAQTRPGARGALLFYSCVPMSEFGTPWPNGLPVQIHGMDADPIFVDEGDIEAARELVESTDRAELFLYAGDQHYFADSSLPSYDADATALLTRRVLDFLGGLDGAARTVAEAPLEDAGSGLAPASEGWFVVNVRDAEWLTSEPPSESDGTSDDEGREITSGAECAFEGRNVEFPRLGVRIHVLQPGERNGLYHGESEQEDFLVLSGECLLLVEGQERRLRAWDFVHSPAWTQHIFVGAGDEPCAILMVGSRSKDWKVRYPVSQLAARYGASAEEDTSDPDQAYVRFTMSRRERPSYWDGLPWA